MINTKQIWKPILMKKIDNQIFRYNKIINNKYSKYLILSYQTNDDDTITIAIAKGKELIKIKNVEDTITIKGNSIFEAFNILHQLQSINLQAIKQIKEKMEFEE